MRAAQHAQLVLAGRHIAEYEVAAGFDDRFVEAHAAIVKLLHGCRFDAAAEKLAFLRPPDANTRRAHLLRAALVEFLTTLILLPLWPFWMLISQVALPAKRRQDSMAADVS